MSINCYDESFSFLESYESAGHSRFRNKTSLESYLFALIDNSMQNCYSIFEIIEVVFIISYKDICTRKSFARVKVDSIQLLFLTVYYLIFFVYFAGVDTSIL